jgi:hypothetical protein
VGGVIGPGADNRGQERVVQVDDRGGKPGYKSGRKDLHVARQDDEVDAVRGE